MMDINKLSSIVLGTLLGACAMGHLDNAEYGVARATLVKGHFDSELMANHMVATDSSGEPTTTPVKDDAFQMPLAGGDSYRLSMIDEDGREHVIRFHQQKGSEHYTEHMHINSDSHGYMMGGGMMNGMMGDMMSGRGMCCGYGAPSDDEGDVRFDDEETEDGRNTSDDDTPDSDVNLEDENSEAIDLGLIQKTEDGFLEPEHNPYAMMDTDNDGENDYIDEDDDNDGIADVDDDDDDGDGHVDPFDMMDTDDTTMGSIHADGGMGTGTRQHDNPSDPTHRDGGVALHDGGSSMMGQSESKKETEQAEPSEDTEETPAEDEPEEADTNGPEDIDTEPGTDHEPGDGPGAASGEHHTDGGMSEEMPRGN